MKRLRLPLPEYVFSTLLTVRITDVNYGGHLGNDAALSLVHEARTRFLRSHGYSEQDMAGVGLIMADCRMVYAAEAFAGDELQALVAVCNPGRIGFECHVRLLRVQDGREIVRAQTGMVCFDYARRAVTALPLKVREKLPFQELP